MNGTRLNGDDNGTSTGKNWRWQLREAVRSLAELAALLPERAEEIASISETAAVIERRFPTLGTPYYAYLIDPGTPLLEDPIFKQVFPNTAELDGAETLGFDPLGEEKDSPVPRLIHRYADRALLLATNKCAVHCRFCLRKRGWSDGAAKFAISDTELAAAAAYLAAHPEIGEVLISGGDPLLLETAELAEIISRISRVPSVKIIRVGTRVPVVLPMRIDDELAELLGSTPSLWVVTHFNHPAELTPESLAACSKLISRGVPMLNQTVLLKGVNDDPDILKELFASLAGNRVKPHYLFHMDPVAGAGHFATGVEKGLEIMKTLRNRISSVATPIFAIDLPGGGGKVPLTPNYERGGAYEGINGELIKHSPFYYYRDP
ncbi:MAG: KamA family radical SAM protein [Kiritimatiellaeota bacterium]|nr:KamA family radical SAM protein [Kiritimatiellota bacterium]